MNEKREKEIMNFIAKHTVKLSLTDSNEVTYAISDMSNFVQELMQFLKENK